MQERDLRRSEKPVLNRKWSMGFGSQVTCRGGSKSRPNLGAISRWHLVMISSGPTLHPSPLHPSPLRPSALDSTASPVAQRLERVLIVTYRYLRLRT